MPRNDENHLTKIERYKRERRAKSNSVGILIEGDSWFNLPVLVNGSNLVLEIKEQLGDKISILDLSDSGDEAREMLAGGQFARLYNTLNTKDVAFDAILFSGGGNDLVGPNMLPLLNDGEGKQSADECINHERLSARIQQIMLAYEELSWMRDDYESNARIYTHAYDFAKPTGKGIRILFEVAGKWVKKRLETKGIKTEFHQAVVNSMLSKFNEQLSAKAQPERIWTHVPTQGTLREGSDWSDELHPSQLGFQKIAAKFVQALRIDFQDRL